jgi:hypothetical protein
LASLQRDATAENAKRLRIVARRHHAGRVLLASWKKGKAAQFFSLRSRASVDEWIEVPDLKDVFC